MATSELERPRTIAREPAPIKQISTIEFGLRQFLSVLASLRLTVVLFAMSIFLIYMGTLAQKDHDVWEVVNDTHFRTWFAWIDFLAFERLAQIFFKDVKWNLPGGFYFPGGNLLGSLLLLNLVAAHTMRFKVAASGSRLKLGLITIAAGVLVTYLAIQSGMNKEFASELSRSFCDTLWQYLRGALALITLGGAYLVLYARGRIRSIEWYITLAIEVLLATLAIWLLAHPEARLDDAGLRILWQLVKGSAAGIVLLAGCVLVFRKRAGIVLLHGGVGLLMLSELFTGLNARESQMTIPIGATVSHSNDFRTSEFAMTDHSDPTNDHVTVVPASLLKANVGKDQPIDDPQLPFKIQVHRWLQNSQLHDAAAGESNPATTGAGKQSIAEDLPPATGVGKRAKFADTPSAYVDLLSKKTGESLGTFLVSERLDDQPVNVDGKMYDVALRFKRIQYPFTLTLKNFEFLKYVGTNTAKDYRSTVMLNDPRHNVDREVPIWMNNPLRYEETTFYQSDFDHKDEQYTVLTAVDNPSWMTPYVACMLVATGMLTHFGILLVRFLKRQTPAPGSEWTISAIWFPAVVVLSAAALVLVQMRMPASEPSEMLIYEFGKLPLAYQGRIKPYDTLALSALQIVSGRQELVIVDKDGKKTYKPAIVWLLDVISGSERANDYQVFRIENLDLLKALGLEPRPQHWRYSLRELETKPGELRRQIDLAKKVPEEEWSLFQKKLMELSAHQNLYGEIRYAFAQSPMPTDPKKIREIATSGSPEEKDKLLEELQYSAKIVGMLRDAEAPCGVPPNDATVEWKPLFEAECNSIFANLRAQPVNPATSALRDLLDAYTRNDVTEFNKQLHVYSRLLGDYEHSLTGKVKELKAAKAEILSQPKIDFEVFYNHFSPFYFGAILYLIAFVLGVSSWVGWGRPLRRASFWLLVFTFVLHTSALVARCYISGRPPITNLYSTAIFIGWGGTLLAMMFELIYGLGLGNIAAAVLGFITLLVAHFLSLDGDTFIVLQAVLDTQFWLATHVISINMGYATTYLAGLWGVLYVLFAHVFPIMNEESRRSLPRILYGTLCFAIYFSFVGTVLGGLWGDDSWGRFWGWDPKENGALMIVLWNALVLHARWGGLVKVRGLATLAILGNIITTWSYFGVNMLGEGLHAYAGFEPSGAMRIFNNPTAMWLFLFMTSQLALACLGMMPQRWFESLRLARRSASE